MELTYRPRRLRRTPALRAMVREHQLSAADFIYPLFVHEGADVEPIGAMPGASRWNVNRTQKSGRERTIENKGG